MSSRMDCSRNKRQREKKKKNAVKREVYHEQGVERIFSKKKKSQKIKIYCAKKGEDNSSRERHVEKEKRGFTL
jgi:hypothetical protein